MHPRLRQLPNPLSLTLATILIAAAALAPAQAPQPSPPTPLPIPAAITQAKTVFLANGGADGGLFPEPFSGDPNRGYFQLYSLLKSAGPWQLAPDPADADLVLQIQLNAPNGPKDVNKSLGSSDPLPYFTLKIYDRKSHFLLWTITEPIQWAVRQTTHDKNFDEAMSKLLADIQALSQPNAPTLYPLPPARPPWQR